MTAHRMLAKRSTGYSQPQFEIRLPRRVAGGGVHTSIVLLICEEKMKTAFKRKQSGFTLVEIAIVLVIIGLLLGAVLKGQELIKSTKVKAVYNLYRELTVAAISYQDRYQALPGDDRNATGRGFVQNGPAITNGNGQGWIDGAAWCANGATGENCQALYHLRLSGFITGSDTLAPTHAFGGPVALARADNFMGTFRRPVAVCFQWLNNETQRMLEAAYDDNSATTGAIRGNADYMVGAPDALSAQNTCMAS